MTYVIPIEPPSALWWALVTCFVAFGAVFVVTTVKHSPSRSGREYMVNSAAMTMSFIGVIAVAAAMFFFEPDNPSTAVDRAVNNSARHDFSDDQGLVYVEDADGHLCVYDSHVNNGAVRLIERLCDDNYTDPIDPDFEEK